MARDQTHRKNWFSLVLIFALILAALPSLEAAERIHTAYFSPAPGASSVIWVAKEARIFEKHGLNVAPVLIPSSVRGAASDSGGEKSPSARARAPRLLAPVSPGVML